MASRDDSSDIHSERSDASDDSSNVDPSSYLINVLKRFEERGAPLSQIILTKKKHGEIDGGADDVPSLQVQSIISLIKSAPMGEGVEPASVLVDTCSYLIHILQDIYRRQQETTDLVSNTACMDALCKALTDRLLYLPVNKETHCLDGCDTILKPPETSKHLPRLLVEIEDHFKQAPAMSKLARGIMKTYGDDVLSVDQYRERLDFPALLDHIMLPMMGEYSFDDCYDALFFSDPDKQDYSSDELIAVYANAIDGNNSEAAVKICVFAGVVRGLEEHKRYHTENDEECVGKECDGHREYEEEEPETVQGWYSSWTEESDKPKKNSFGYGIKLGSIIEYAYEHAKVISSPPPQGTPVSSPRARFHQDMLAEEAKLSPATDTVGTTLEDIVICRAKHSYVESDAFQGDGETVYSSKMWCHDGRIGFSHVGGGWKNREFIGHIYETNGTFESHELCHEFWSTPDNILADGMNETIWISADKRIKGFAIENGQPCTKFIFNLLSNKEAMASVTATGAQSKLKIHEGAGNENLIVFGSSRLGYLSEGGILQEWKLSDANQHDGIRREVRMYNLDEDIAAWDEEEVLNMEGSTYMDESGLAEVTRGKKPDSIRFTGVDTPCSIGYLPNEKFAFAYNGQSEITMYDCNLRETSRLVGFGTDKVDVVQRPTFEIAGDPYTFVASDARCAKIFDLRSGKAEMTIHQRCVSSLPVYLNDAKFVCNKLSEGQGAMLWDLRSQRPLYSLPISGNTNMAWIPSSTNASVLLTENGEYYQFGENPARDEQDHKWEVKNAESAWSELESKRKNDSGVSECCIM